MLSTDILLAFIRCSKKSPATTILRHFSGLDCIFEDCGSSYVEILCTETRGKGVPGVTRQTGFSDGEGCVCCGKEIISLGFEELRWLGSGKKVCCKADIVSNISASKFSTSALVANSVPSRQVTVSACIPWLTNFVSVLSIFFGREVVVPSPNKYKL